MAVERTEGEEHPGFKWAGIFTARIPFYHTRVEWPELAQGIVVAAATGLGIVPVMVAEFGLTFEEAVTCVIMLNVLISSAPILFGEPFAAGWITPALPLALAFVIGGYDTGPERFQAMTALTLNLTFILLFFGITGLGRRFIEWLPPALKGGIIMGAAIAALKRVFVDDFDDYLGRQPIATTTALALCLLLVFSVPLQKYKAKYKWMAMLAALGLLPGFLAAAFIGGITGEVAYNIEWGILNPPITSFFEKATPFFIGLPSLEMFIAGFPLAIVTYVILFGDVVTGIEILRAAEPARPDEKIVLNPTRTHFSLAIRNALMGIFAPFFPTQGPLWTGVHVIICQRWAQGKKSVDSLYSGISSYYVFGVPILLLVLPIITGLRDLMGIALSLTLVLTGFACAYIAMAIPRNQAQQGVVLLTGVALALFEAWVGLLIGIAATILLVGFREEPASPTPGPAPAPLPAESE